MIHFPMTTVFRCVAALTALMAAGTSAIASEAQPGEEGVASMARVSVFPPARTPDRPAGEGEGPFERLVIRGGTLVDGTGAPAIGPVDIVIEGDRISSIRSVGAPGVPIEDRVRPEAGDHEIDATDMMILPGFIDTHVHIGSLGQGRAGSVTPPEYVFKLWMAHGITTGRDVGAGMGLGWTLDHKERSDAGEITAPRLKVHARFPPSTESAQDARRWVKAVADKGADGLKFFGGNPAALEAAISEAKERGLKTAFHHAQLSVSRVNVLDSARWGLDSMEHWYGLPEALFVDRQVQDYPHNYNYANEQDRFGEAGRLWAQAAEAGSEKWNAVIEELISLNFTLSPTLTIYEANRDVMRARNADWHSEYTWPGLARFFVPDPTMHGSYHFDWTTEREIQWKRNYVKWMSFLNDYKNAGGRVTTGSDSGFIFKVYGFGYIRELELLQESGFHPLEVVTAATLNGAELLGIDDETGSVEPGKKADLVLVRGNPLANFKLLYGTGHMQLNPDTLKVQQVGGVEFTIKDGIIWNAGELLADVREMVSAEKAREAAP